MYIKGKYRVEIKEDSNIVKVIEKDNIIVNGGIDHVADWLEHNIYSDNYYSGLKEIDTTGMAVTSQGFTNPNNAVDGSDATYTTSTIDSASWDNDWWKINFGESKDLLAIYVDWTEDDVNRGADYKFQYSANDSDWFDFDVRLRPPQESLVRGKVLFYVTVTPPFDTQAVKFLRLNTKRGDDNETFNVYQLKFYETNFLPQPPLVIGLGTGTTTPTENDTALESSSITKKVSNVARPATHIVRYIMSLGTSEGNGVSFSEIGAFFNGSDNHSLQTTSNATTLFSRALFDTPWSKTEGQTADVWYELSVSNTDFVSSSSSSSSSSTSSSSTSSSSSSLSSSSSATA